MFQIVSALALHFYRTLKHYRARHLMYNYPMNHWDMWTILVWIVDVSDWIVRALMFTAYLSFPGRVRLCWGRRTGTATLVLALNIALHSFLVSSSMYCALFPGSHLFVPFSRYLVLGFFPYFYSLFLFLSF